MDNLLNTNFSLFSIVSLLLSIFSLGLSILIFINSTNSLHRVWALFNFSLIFWSGCLFLASISKKPEDATEPWKYAYFFGIFVTTTFYHFNHLFCEIKKNFNLLLIYSIGICFIPVCLFAPNFIEIHYIFNSIYYHKATLLFNIYITAVLLVVVLSFKELINYVKNIEPRRKNEGLYVLYCFALGWAGGITTFLPAYSIPVYPTWHFTIVIYIIVMTYAVFRFQLMDIQVIIRKSLVYSLLVSSITILFLLLVLISERFFHRIVGYQDLTSSIFIAVIIALLSTPIKNLMQNLVDKAFFKATPIEIANENERLRQEIIQTEKLKSIALLASGVAHEIKNPLTALKTFGEFLPQKITDQEFLKKFSPIINQEITRIDKLVHELLDFAKPSPVHLKPTNINRLIDSTLEFLSNDLFKHKIKVSKDYRLRKDQHINLDPKQFRQAILNILLNAIEAMPNGGSLTIATFHSHKKGAKIKIQDSGIGISKDDLSHLFDPFFSKKDSGTGLGLSITHEIIKKHGGRILVESELGIGSTFIIEMPNGN